MRYYSIVLKNPKTGAILQPASLGGTSPQATYTSFVNGKTLPGALNVEIDIPTNYLSQPIGKPFIRVWGISLQEIAQSAELTGTVIEVYGGMQKGLPLANPKQAGLLFSGVIFQALGNWVGTAMTLDLVVYGGESPITGTPNLTFDWKKGTPLSQAIDRTLSTAFPKIKRDIKISSDLVLANDEPGFYSDVVSFAQYIKQRSAAIIGGTYPGVDIALSETTFKVYDGTTQTTPLQIQFQDMIGQPTWIDPATVQVKFVMRADISVGDYVKFPVSPTISSPAANSPFISQRLTFQGTFLVKRVRHVGDFRNPDASSWVTIVDATAPPIGVPSQKAA